MEAGIPKNMLGNDSYSYSKTVYALINTTCTYVCIGQKSIDVTAKNVVHQTDQPQLSTAVHSQQAHSGQKTTEASNATASSSIRSICDCVFVPLTRVLIN